MLLVGVGGVSLLRHKACRVRVPTGHGVDAMVVPGVVGAWGEVDAGPVGDAGLRKQ